MNKKNPPMQGPENCRGISLVIVLGSLVLLSALVVAFLVQMTTELKSSKIYADGVSARLLSQSASNIAVSQIQAATWGEDGAGNILAWASQPGMIRTYDTAGDPHQYFKLYSDDQMILSGFNAGSAEPPSTWFDNKAFYTDLNEPIRVDGANHYPIVDGNSLTNVPGVPGLSYDADGTDGNGDGLADIDGFYVDGAPLATLPGTTPNPVPMPVKWLYVLANGEVVAPVLPGGSSKPQTVQVPGANNSPIVGRVAFWTDDETCKINVNTASEGAFTDTPRVNSQDDRTLAENQPLQGEYQRYPGHPATTSLSTVIKAPAGLTAQQWAEELYSILPRIKEGGSVGGSIPTYNTTQTPLTADTDRLYATVDEFAFKPTLGGSTRLKNNPTVLNTETLKRAKFFLTTSSRSPDLNLFNKPRVSIWPITLNTSTGTPMMTPFDRLIAFCSTMGSNLAQPYIYYFQRQDSNHPHTDLPRANEPPTGLGRNRTLLEYLRRLTSENIPGFGGSFAAKYSIGNGGGGTDRDQILTQIFDYIRSTNLRDTTLGSSWEGQYAKGFGTSLGGVGQVVPIVDRDTGTRGFGRFPTVQQASLVFIGVADDSVTPVPTPPVAAGMRRVQAALFLQLFDPSQGTCLTRPWYSFSVEGLDGFTWNGVPMGFPPGPLNISRPYTGNTGAETFFGGLIGFRQLIYKKGTYGGMGDPYSLVSGTIDLPSGSPFAFTGGDLKINVYRHEASGTRAEPPVQTLTLNFPDGDFPVPALAPADLDGHNFRSFTAQYGRLNCSPNDQQYIRGEDVVRSVVATPGDMRLIAARENITAEQSEKLFGVLPSYSSTNRRHSHNLRSGQGRTNYGGHGGKIVNLNYPHYQSQYLNYNYDSKDCDVPSQTGVFQAGNLPPDFDNGIANLRDGAYINKADEGDRGYYSGSFKMPYFNLDYSDSLPGPTLFSPNRLIPSAVMFGSLPSGVWADAPWRTLLFRPGPQNHFGLGSPASDPPTPPDHLLLDLFHMPVVEPYAIGEPLSTAGRINLNHQVIPFTYINRDTGIRAVFKAEKILAISDSNVATYKQYKSGPGPMPASRFEIDAAATLSQFKTRKFDNNDIFRSASEICSIDLVPNDPALSNATKANPTRAAMDAYWNTHRLTGDNSRERPYANIYPRLTTKSNSFKIYIRTQSLKKAKGTPSDLWTEGVDQVTGEYRGSQLIERYIDPNNPGILDYADPAVTAPISELYKVRVLMTQQFAP